MSPKERILKTAAELFPKQGYNTTGINQIIAESKVAKASFYQHYKSKDDLCVAFLNLRHQFWFDELIKYTSKETLAKGQIMSSFDFLIYMNEKEQFRGCSFQNILSEIQSDNVKVLNVIQSHKFELRNYFIEIVNDKPLANHIYLLFESCIIESRLFKSNELITEAKNIVQALIN